MGNQLVKNVIASVAPDKANPLLGQSFLKQLPAWTLDNKQPALVFGSASAPAIAPGTLPAPATPSPPVTPWLPGTSSPSEELLSADELLDKGRAADLFRHAYPEARQWYRRAADQGSVHALYLIGSLYLKGQGVSQDNAEAMQWFRKAAERGDQGALDKIGIMYMRGEGAPQDYAQAMLWFRKAADQEWTNARLHIGYLYLHGLGVLRDCTVATQWTGLSDTVSCDLQHIGDCTNTAVKAIRPAHARGIEILFANGGFGTSYEPVPSISQSQAGDPIQLCLEAIPEGRPVGDDRGRVYHATNWRTNGSWSLPDPSSDWFD